MRKANDKADPLVTRARSIRSSCTIFALVELPDASTFLQRLFGALERDRIATDGLVLDHLCYRVGTMERYTAWKDHLAMNGTLLGEHTIGGRPIATFLLRKPILFQGRAIDVVELPAPKPGSPYAEGWEHAEFVVSEDPCVFAARYPTLPWDHSGAWKTTNADVRLGYAGFSVKFHERALAEVIAEEQ
ncbi:MAG: VOC family protein [Flavobacteriales bacterium]|nr:VOC family protein [Flavobacteriales bacterium]